MKNKDLIFKKGSKTFYTASMFFPRHVRRDVTRLYAFVRIADDFVDQVPPNKKGFYDLKKKTSEAFKGNFVTDEVVQDFVLLCGEYGIEKKWVDAFLDAMQQDLTKRRYMTFVELEQYMFGSAEVIGLMMARILKLPKKAEKTARFQGKALQLINFIRDVQEDLELKRQYLPQEDLEKFGIQKLSSRVDEKAFRNLIEFEINRYKIIQSKARAGYSYIPRKVRIPIATAVGLYAWTAEEILKNPMIVFKKKIKPSKWRILKEYLQQFFIV